jgi:hypothetical protein
MTRSVAAWEDDGGAGRPRFGSPVAQRGNSDKATTAPQSVTRKRPRHGDVRMGKLRECIAPVIVQADN